MERPVVIMHASMLAKMGSPPCRFDRRPLIDCLFRHTALCPRPIHTHRQGLVDRRCASWTPPVATLPASSARL